jgi:hypothetical protein
MRFAIVFLLIHARLGHISLSSSFGVHAFSTTTPPSPPTNVVTIVTPKHKKTLHFCKGEGQLHIQEGGPAAWELQIEQDIQQCDGAGTLPKHLLDQIPPVITRWARKRSSLGATKAQILLGRYVQEYTAGNPHAKLEVRLFNIAMDAWTKSRRTDAPEQIQKLFKQMQDLRTSHIELSTLVPDVISLSSLCLAWAKSRLPDAAQRATTILEYMEREGLRPNTITYNAVLLAHVHSQRRDKAIQVERIIARMIHRQELMGHDECRPDVCSYQSLIAAWSRTRLSGTPQKAEEVLEFMNMESRMGKAYLAPNCHCYVAAIHAWSHSEERCKSRRAYEILCHMRDLYEQTKKQELKPNVVAYTAVLNACALPVDKLERESALSIALLVMEELRVYGHDRPNFLTYAAFLHVLGSTIPHGTRRDTLALKYFRQAKARGQVGFIVLEKLHTASPTTYHAIAEKITEQDDHGNDVVRIPHAWGKNVVGERDPMTRVIKDDTTTEIQKANYIKLQEVKRKRGTKTNFHAQLNQENDRAPVQYDDFTIKWSEESL